MSLKQANRHRALRFVLVSAVLYFSLALVSCGPWYKKYNIKSDDELASISVIPELCKALKDEDPDIRIKAAKALGNIGPDALSALPDLEEAMEDENYSVRMAAADATERIVAKLVEKDEKYREAMISVHIVRLGSKSWIERRDAADSLGEMGEAAARAVPALINALLDQSSWNEHYYEVQRAAARALGEIGFKARAANPALIKALGFQDYSVRIEAARALGRIGPKSNKEVVAALKDALDDPDFDVRREAAVSLGAFEEHGEVAMAKLVDALSDQDFDVRREAAKTLGRIGPDSDSVVNALLFAVLNDTDEDVRAAAVLALGNVTPAYRKKVLPAVITALDDESDKVRLCAVQTITDLGIYNDDVDKALERAGHEDKLVEVKQAALEALVTLKTGGARQVASEEGKTEEGPVSVSSISSIAAGAGVATAAGAAASAAVQAKASETAAGVTVAPKIVKITADVLNIRSGPGIENAKVGRLLPNEKPQVLEVDGEWVKIQKQDGVVGYVSKDYLVLEEGAGVSEAAAAPKIRKITADVLNIRSGPGLGYKRVGRLFANEKPKVLKVEGQWVKIEKANGTTGYVSMDYVILEGE